MPNPYDYFPAGWDARYLEKKANAARERLVVTCVGDSFMQGTGADDQVRQGWVALLEAELARQLGRHAWFDAATYSDDFDMWFTNVHFTGVSPLAVNPNLGRSYVNRAFGKCPVWTGGTAVGSGLLTYVTRGPSTAIDLLTVDLNAGSFTVSIDGGPPKTVATGNSGYLKRTCFSGLSPSVHTLVIDSQSAANVCVPFGLISYTGEQGGVLLSNVASPAEVAVATLGGNFAGIPTAEQTLAGRTSATAPGGFGPPTEADLFIWGLGINDCQYPSAGGVPDFRDVVRRDVEGVRKGCQDASLMFVANWLYDPLTSDITTGFLHPEKWLEHVMAMRDVAEYFGGCLLNLQPRFGQYPVRDGLVLAANSHPTTPGHRRIFEAVMGYL